MRSSPAALIHACMVFRDGESERAWAASFRPSSVPEAGAASARAISRREVFIAFKWGREALEMQEVDESGDVRDLP